MNVLILPEYPDKEFYTIVAIFLRLGYFATQDPDGSYEFALSWQDVTWQAPCAALERVSKRVPVVNLHCRDISKRRVEREFSRVFGYSSFIDPAASRGRGVRKHDRNALGGFVVDLPVEPGDAGETGEFVYQKFLDSSRGEAMIEYRVPIILGRIPVVYEEHKDLPEREIKTRKQKVELTDAGAVFSPDEITRILSFCNGIGLDFGELDIIRDNDDGRVYIIDANKTPGGFGMFNKVNWAHEQRQRAIELLSTAFDRGIRERIGAAAAE